MTTAPTALAQLIIDARRNGKTIASSHGAPLPKDFLEAYAIQEQVAASIGDVGGWKVGASSPDGEPYCAPIFASTIHDGSGSWSPNGSNYLFVETEIAFRFGRDLTNPANICSEDDVWDAVESVHPAIEIVASRFTDFSALSVETMAADNLNNAALFLGAPARVSPRTLDFSSQQASLLVDGMEVEKMTGGNPCGNVGRLLTWLANHCLKRDRPLRAGSYVTTGTHTGMYRAALDTDVLGRLAGIGEARVRLASSIR